MNHRLDPSPALFATTMVVLANVINLPVHLCQTTGPYDACAQLVQCGEKNFEYPFWGLGRPQHCGHPNPSFQLTCPSNVPALTLDSVGYRVLDLNSSAHTITVARNDLWSNSCAQYLRNTTYNTALFNGNNFGQENVSLYYGCQDNFPAGNPLTSYQFSCDVNQTGASDSYFYRTNLINADIGSLLVQCNSYITVPVDESRVNRLGPAPPATESDLRSALQEGFKLQWTANNDVCDRCVRSQGRCGSNSTSPNGFVCYCASRNFSATCNNISVESGEVLGIIGAVIAAVVGIIGAVIAAVVVVVGFGILVFRQRRKGGTVKERVKLFYQNVRSPAANDKTEIFIRNYRTLAPKRYKYSEIEKMTKSFLEKLGQGGFGSVYKGQLHDGRQVAVKLLSEATGNGEDFINEVASIGRTSHVNVVTLLGFCFEGNKRALLYELMPNGSLDKFLRGDGVHLDWNTLFQIAKGIARGLEYLHGGCNTRIVHFDIKPQNILLDAEFVPKISDFGLAKLCKKKESIVSVSGARGTAGYMAPEVHISSLGGASHKSDVYSYGMMILEMTGARKYNNARKTSTSDDYFPDWIFKQVEVGGNLGDNEVTNAEEDELARKMMMVSLWCIQTDPSDRPSISKVVEMLEGSFESLQVPPRRFELSPPRPFPGTLLSSMQSSSGDRVSSTVQGSQLMN